MPRFFGHIFGSNPVTGNLISVSGPGDFGALTVRMSPFGRPPSTVQPTPKPTDFAATSIAGKQGPISIVFERVVDFIEITAKNSSVDGNKMIAFDVDGNVLNETFFGKGTSLSLFGRRVTFGEFESQRRIEIPKIKRIELHPTSAEGFIFWGDFRVRLEEESVTTNLDDPSRPERKTLEIPLQIRAIRRPGHKERTIQIAFEIEPPIPLFERDPDVTDTVLVVRPLPIDIELAIDNITEAIISPLINSFFDDDRELKTVLNFGLDFQSVLVNWRRDSTNLENHGILVKLLEPLPIARDVKELVWISRELSPSWTDKLFVTFTEAPGIIFFLRPPNRSTNVTQLFGKEVSEVTLNDLLPSGSIQTSDATLTLNDPILRQFYNTEAAQGIELLIDYADYNNFVHFSSAENRLNVFREKLQQIEVLDRDLAFQTAAASQSLLSGTLTDVSGTAQFTAMTTLIEDRERLVRGFDGYERFLFFETGSFSSSLSGLPEDTLFIRDNVAWPKDGNGVVLAVTSSASLAYFDDQSTLAVDYDLANQEALKNNVPLYLQNDADSAEYITFLNMIGHSFDGIKGYIDAMSDIYDRDPSPERGLSNDLIWNVAQSMGIDLPNQYSIKQLVDFTIGQASTTQETYRRAISETWKRFLHNQIFIAKSKGTQTGIQALLNTYGIVPEMLRVRESVTPSPVFTTGSYELFEELTNAVQLTNGASIAVPFNATGLFSPATIELRFATALGTGSFADTVLMHASPLSWSVVLSPTGSEANSRGFLQVLDSTGAALATSTVDRFFTGDFYSIMLRQNNTGSVVDFFVRKFEDDVFDYEFSSSITTDFSESFKTADVVLGNASRSAFDTSSNDVRIDEFRLWNELISEQTFYDHVQFPGMYAGNNFESANESLIFRHSFGFPQDLVATASLPNDTPFISSGSVASILTASVASGFTSSVTFPNQFVRFSRQTKRFTPNAGGSQFSSNKVTIAPSASFRTDALTITGSSVIPVLSRDKSIVTTTVERADAIKPDNRLGMYFTLAETINDSVLRSIGNFDLNDLIGDPSQLYDDGNTYKALVDLNKFYVRNYSPTFNQNAFIRFVEDLMEGVFSQVKTLIPIQTKLLTGVVIEPTILERNRIRLNRPLELSGKGSRNETQARTILVQSGSYPDARNVEATVETVLTASMSAIDSTLEATISQTDIPISGTLQLLEVQVAETTRSVTAFIDQLLGLVDTDEDVLNIIGSTLAYSASVDLDSSTDLAALINILSGKVSATSSLVLEGTVPTSLAVIDADIIGTVTAVGVDFLVPVIESANDLTDRRNREFFHHVSGSVGLVGFQKQRIRENLINDRGDWFKGGIYEEHDVVILSGSQYRSLTTRVLTPDGTPVIFVSQIQPNQDPTNWTPVSFRTIIVPRLFKAVVSGSSHVGTGSVALVPFDQPGGVFTGYSQNHYKFFRDTGTAYIRSRFKGVLQTIDTTTDGRSPIETLLSSDAQLFVKDGTPRQTTKDEAGPVLEVRPDEPNQ